MTRNSIGTGIALGIILTLPVIPAHASNNHIPQPWRQDAVVQGRNEPPNTERFLHELTFHHLHTVPGPSDNGIRGTGGSVSSRQLYLDFRFRNDFGFNDNRQGFLLDVQRSEDLDGAYQRQLVGFRHNLTDRTELWLQGDVFSDKSESDVYFSVRHHLDGKSWIHGSWILPDAYFNDKTRTQDEFRGKPQSFFLQWRQASDPATPALGTTASATVSPESRLLSRSENLLVENESIKAALTHRFRQGNWRWHAELSGERTRRDYRLFGGDTTTSPTFSRDHIKLDTSVTDTGLRYRPRLGLSYLALDEEGFFGRELNDIGTIRRREPTLYGDLSLPLSPRTSLSPGLYLSIPDIRQTFSEHRSRRHHSFTGKLTLPFEMVISEQDHAMLTLSPTFYLHKFGFGGGNLQLHWPM
ncbi:hypothetical protein EHN06_17885 [Marinobacter sp. NP-4(2019)]|uniref:hypothetical protein n=1 Tax=Marinobacter sp. NP-4(2019) TaxID=2488665 RepID=UPI000FC3D9F4|nr:hypothetical protein [Marinobacter sp. NP-4(2019)]AZT85273.1 hypothetical protein EHN06_17885 [Marinobacter sp. NP-4(2019)]